MAFQDGPPNVSAFSELSLGRYMLQLATLGAVGACGVGVGIATEPWAWAVLAGVGGVFAVIAAPAVWWCVRCAGRRTDDDALVLVSALMHGAVGFGWGAALQGGANELLFGSTWLRPLFAETVLVSVPWMLPCAVAFTIFGWFHATSVAHRWPTWDLVVICACLLPVLFAGPTVVALAIRLVVTLLDTPWTPD